MYGRCCCRRVQRGRPCSHVRLGSTSSRGMSCAARAYSCVLDGRRSDTHLEQMNEAWQVWRVVHRSMSDRERSGGLLDVRTPTDRGKRARRTVCACGSADEDRRETVSQDHIGEYSVFRGRRREHDYVRSTRMHVPCRLARYSIEQAKRPQ